MIERKLGAEACLSLLKKKSEELFLLGEKRLPKRSDFTFDEVNAIKSHFGPWPRALEKAGLKPERDDGWKEKQKEKHARSKLLRKESRKQNR